MFPRMPTIFLFVLITVMGTLAAAERPNVAVLPFTGDKSVSAEQLTFITGKFAAELAATQEFQILDRSRVDFILQEQGFQQSGACDGAECRMQIGQMLGVDHIVVGTLVQFGNKYAFRADYVNVGDGRVEQSVEQSEKGELSEVYEAICQQSSRALALKVHPLTPEDVATLPTLAAAPASRQVGISFKRKLALGLWGSSLLAVGGGAYYHAQAMSAREDYDAAWDSFDRNAALSAYADYNDYRSGRNICFAVGAGTALLGAVLWFWPD